MQKNLIAVAVGGALAAVGAAPALAQNATVNVYGTLYGEYASINNGAKTGGVTDGYQRYDHFQNPGSELGFRGEEKLGGGLSAWFQCSATMEYRGSGNSSSTNAQAGGTLCTRNSALGVKGAFGNIFYGNWNTPFARISVAGNTGANETGVFGNSHILAGTSTTTGISSPQQTIPTVAGATVIQSAAAVGTALPVVVGAGTGINALQPAVFRRRQNNLFTYETPNFSGFSAMGAVTTRNNASAATQVQLKTRLWSMGAQYANGPIYVGVGYEKHSDFYNLGTAAAPIGGDDRGWTVSASYTFSNNLKLGGVYHDLKSNTAVGVTSTVKTWHVGIDWMISGPHGIRAGYSRAGDVGGPLGAGCLRVRLRVPVPLPICGRFVTCTMLSKRTELNLGYSRTNNSTFSGYETGGASTTQFGGSDSNAFAGFMRHTF